MNMKSGLLGLGLLVTAGVVTVSCGGSSDGDNNNTAGKGSTGTSGSTGTAGTGSSTAGTTGSSTAGTTGSSTAGTTSTGGNAGNTGGNAGSTGGNGNTTGGMNNNDGGAGPNNPACPATAPTDGAACTVMTGRAGCDYDTTNCRCQRVFGGGGPGAGGEPAAEEREWNCNEQVDPGGFGGFGNDGGAGNVGDVVCPATAPMADDACTGTGLCTYGQDRCVCFQGTFRCF